MNANEIFQNMIGNELEGLIVKYLPYNDTFDVHPYRQSITTDFEEQFADYLVLRTFPDKFSEARGVLHKVLGDEWFTMMDDFYDKVTKRVCEKSKIYQYK